MPALDQRKGVGDAARFVPDGVRHDIADTADAGDADGRHAGGETIVGLAGNQQVARDVEIGAAHAVQRLEDVAVVGELEFVQHGGRHEAGVLEGEVLLALGPVLPEERMRIDDAAELVDVLNAVAAEDAVLVAEIVVHAQEHLTVVDGGARIAGVVVGAVEFGRTEVAGHPELE